VEAGSHIGAISGASKTACEFFDRLSQQMGGKKYPHVHYVPGTTTGKIEGSEVKGLVPGRKLKPDSYLPDLKEVWLFHGNHFHGYPLPSPTTATQKEQDRFYQGRGIGGTLNSTLYEATVEAMDAYKKAGYVVKYVWEHDFKGVTCVKWPKPIQSIIRVH